MNRMFPLRSHLKVKVRSKSLNGEQYITGCLSPCNFLYGWKLTKSRIQHTCYDLHSLQNWFLPLLSPSFLLKTYLEFLWLYIRSIKESCNLRSTQITARAAIFTQDAVFAPSAEHCKQPSASSFMGLGGRMSHVFPL